MLNCAWDGELVEVEAALFGEGVNLMRAAHSKSEEEGKRVAKVVADGRPEGVELRSRFVGEEDGMGEDCVYGS